MALRAPRDAAQSCAESGEQTCVRVLNVLALRIDISRKAVAPGSVQRIPVQYVLLGLRTRPIRWEPAGAVCRMTECASLWG